MYRLCAELINESHFIHIHLDKQSCIHQMIWHIEYKHIE